VEEDHAREHLNKLGIYKCMGPGEIHTRVLKKLTGVFVTPLSIVFERSQGSGEVAEGLKKTNVTPIFRK